MQEEKRRVVQAGKGMWKANCTTGKAWTTSTQPFQKGKLGILGTNLEIPQSANIQHYDWKNANQEIKKALNAFLKK